MQEMCVRLFKCAAALNGFWEHEIHNVYVTDSQTAASGKTVGINSGMCVGGTSPAGPGNANNLPVLQVPPFDLHKYILTKGIQTAIMKIDTEGYEPIILRSLLPLFSSIDNLFIEVTPGRWTDYGLDWSSGMSVFKEMFGPLQRKCLFLPEGDFNFHISDPKFQIPSFEAFETHLRDIADKRSSFKNYWFFSI